MDYDQIGLVSTDSVRMLGQSMWIWPPKMGWPDDPNAEHQHRNDEYLHWRSKKYPINIKKNMTTSHVILYVFCYPSVFFSLPGLISGPPAVPQHLQLAENHHCLASQIPSVIKVGGLREISKNLEKMGINGPFWIQDMFLSPSFHHLFTIFSWFFLGFHQ